MLEQFIAKKFRKASLAIIAQANAIIAEYMEAGFTLTLRQLYYQFVARGYLANKQQNYDNLGATISDARLCGLIDWDAIEDRTRFLRGHTAFEDPQDAIKKTLSRYRIDMWKGQKRRVEVWIEKDALIGVIERACSEYDVNYFACRGYASQSELHSAGKRIAWRRKWEKQDTLVIHLGDHDPSGCDMTRDNEDRLSLFAGRYVQVDRIALNMDQVEHYNPPPNPAKLTDSRAQAYIAEHGDESWELDALEPRAIHKLIEDRIKKEIDVELWEGREAQFDMDKEHIEKASRFVGMDDAFKEMRDVLNDQMDTEPQLRYILDELDYLSVK